MEDAPGIVQAGTSTSIFLLVNVASLAEEKDFAAGTDFELVINQEAESNSDGLTFSQPPGDYLPTKANIERSGRNPEINLVEKQVTDQQPQSVPLPEKHPSPKKTAKKPDPKPEKTVKENVAKTQKPLARKLFGWL
jgi:outer membrane biosynthesis protein TonB